MDRFLKSLSLGSVLCLVLFLGCTGESLLSPDKEAAVRTPSSSTATGSAWSQANDQACWGQATKVFAQMGEMGEHASQQPTPRLGLRNLARALYEEGVIPDDSLQALGAFVASAYGLSIDACM
jgi:hypothetical protein